jgi:hypothetical protein
MQTSGFGNTFVVPLVGSDASSRAKITAEKWRSNQPAVLAVTPVTTEAGECALLRNCRDPSCRRIKNAG